MRKIHNMVIKHMTPEEYEKTFILNPVHVGAKKKTYTDKEGNEFTYSQMCDKVNEVLGDNTWQGKTIFDHMNMDHMANVHLLPTMTNDNLLEHIRRGVNDMLFYRKAEVNLLQELLHPVPKFNIKSVIRVHMR